MFVSYKQKSIKDILEVIGFEPMAFCMQNRHSKPLSYTPITLLKYKGKNRNFYSWSLQKILLIIEISSFLSQLIRANKHCLRVFCK